MLGMSTATMHTVPATMPSTAASTPMRWCRATSVAMSPTLNAVLTAAGGPKTSCPRRNALR